MFMPTYISNIYRLDVGNLDELYISITPSKALSVSISRISRFLKDFIVKNKSNWQGKWFIYVKDRYLIVLSSSEEMVHELVNYINEFRKSGKSSTLSNYHSFTKTPDELKPIAYAALAKALEKHILLSLSKEGWTILAERRVYKDLEELVVDLPQPLSDYVRLYRGVDVVVLPLTLYNVFGTRYLSIGLCIDPALVIEPIKSLYDLLNDGLEYTENKLLRKTILKDELFGYDIVKYEVWDILKMANKSATVLKMIKNKKGVWEPKVEEVDLREVYPLRRAEIIDRILGRKYRLSSGSTLTRIIKRESFHITEEGKRDEQASYKRYLVTVRFHRVLREVISKHRLFGKLEVTLEEKPLMILTMMAL